MEGRQASFAGKRGAARHTAAVFPTNNVHSNRQGNESSRNPAAETRNTTTTPSQSTQGAVSINTAFTGLRLSVATRHINTPGPIIADGLGAPKARGHRQSAIAGASSNTVPSTFLAGTQV